MKLFGFPVEGVLVECRGLHDSSNVLDIHYIVRPAWRGSENSWVFDPDSGIVVGVYVEDDYYSVKFRSEISRWTPLHKVHELGLMFGKFLKYLEQNPVPPHSVRHHVWAAVRFFGSRTKFLVRPEGSDDLVVVQPTYFDGEDLAREAEERIIKVLLKQREEGERP